MLSIGDVSLVLKIQIDSKEKDGKKYIRQKQQQES